MQELVSNLSLGTLPRSIWVSLEDDLVDTCKPGDDVIVVGRRASSIYFSVILSSRIFFYKDRIILQPYLNFC
jgi:DNA replicative helicase MCM subunit Mcm2 (Cdc46/Mcm family)